MVFIKFNDRESCERALEIKDELPYIGIDTCTPFAIHGIDQKEDSAYWDSVWFYCSSAENQFKNEGLDYSIIEVSKLRSHLNADGRQYLDSLSSDRSDVNNQARVDLDTLNYLVEKEEEEK
jgi:hypothetical protein